MTIRRLLPVLNLLLIACRSTGSQGVARVDTTMVFVIPPGTMHDFPHVDDSSRILSDGSLLPDPSAPPCVERALPDTQAWSRSSGELKAAPRVTASIRLPGGFAP